MRLSRPSSLVAALLFASLLPCLSASAQSPAKPKPAPPPTPKQLESRSWQMLDAALSDDSSDRRIEAITALSTIGPRRSVTRLIEARLSDKHHDVRHVAAATLGEMRSRRSIPALKKSLHDPELAVSFAAALALWNLGDRSGRAILLDVLAGERNTGPGFLKGGVRDAKKFARPTNLATTGAKQGAYTLLGPFALGIPLVEALRKDGGAPDRALSASLLAEDSDPESIVQLEAALADNNWAVRAAAARALADLAQRRPDISATQRTDPPRAAQGPQQSRQGPAPQRNVHGPALHPPVLDRNVPGSPTGDSASAPSQFASASAANNRASQSTCNRILHSLAPLLDDDKPAVRLIAAASILRMTRFSPRQ